MQVGYDADNANLSEFTMVFNISEVQTDVVLPEIMDGWLGVRFEYTLRIPTVMDEDDSVWL
jgi:hypothetical protein